MLLKPLGLWEFPTAAIENEYREREFFKNSTSFMMLDNPEKVRDVVIFVECPASENIAGS